MFTVKAASLDRNVVTLDQLEQIVDSFRFTQEVDKKPKIDGNSIKIKITNTNYSPNNVGYLLFYEYTFIYNRRSDDEIKLIRQGFGQGVEVHRQNATLFITKSFDGGQLLFSKIPNPILIDNPSSDRSIYRVNSNDQAYLNSPPLVDYEYVTYYQENKPATVGNNSCGSGVDPIAACAAGLVTINKEMINLSCNADSNSVHHCDDIVKRLTVRSVGLD